MQKIIVVIFLILLIQGCGKQDKDYIEICANQKTSSYWNSRADQFKNEALKWITRKILAKDKYEKEAAQNMINSKEYYIELYTNASKKKLSQKLYEFPLFEENFKKCEKEFIKNPIYFKEIYKN